MSEQSKAARSRKPQSTPSLFKVSTDFEQSEFESSGWKNSTKKPSSSSSVVRSISSQEGSKKKSDYFKKQPPFDSSQNSFSFEAEAWGGSADPSIKESKKLSSNFDEDLLSSEDLSAAFPPKKSATDAPSVAVTKVETSKVSLGDSFSPETTDPTTERKHSTERRSGRGRSSSRGRRRKRPSDIEETHSKEDTSNNPRARDSASDLGTADPSSEGNTTGQGRRSSSRGRRSTTVVTGRPGIIDERSSPVLPKMQSNIFDHDLLSSKDLSFAIPPHEIAPDAPLVAAIKVEGIKVEGSNAGLGNSIYPETTDSTTQKNYSAKSESDSTERRSGRGRSSSRGRRARSSGLEEKPDEEAPSKEDSAIKRRARSSSRGARRRESVSELGTADPSSGENSAGQGRRSRSTGRRMTSSNDPGELHATKENSKQNPARARSNSRGRRRASLVSMGDSLLSADPTQSSGLPSSSLDGVRRNAPSNKDNAASSLSAGPTRSSLDVIQTNTAKNPLSSSKNVSGHSLHDAPKHLLSSMSNLEAKSWGSLQESFSNLDTMGRGVGSRSGRAPRRMPKGTADQDKYMDSSSLKANKGISETTVQSSSRILNVDLQERFRSDFPLAKDMPTYDELKERYRNAQCTASQQAEPTSTETDTSEPQIEIKDEDEKDEEALETITTIPKKNYSDKLMAATKGKPASSTMRIKATRENTPDPVKTEPKQAKPKLGAPKRGPGMIKLVRSVSKKFSSKTSAIDSDGNGFVSNNSSSGLNKSKKQGTKEDKNNQARKMMRKDKKDDAQPGGDDALLQTTSILNVFDQVEPSGDSKEKKDQYDSPRTRSGSRPRSGREQDDETAPNKNTKKEQHNTLGDSTITTGVEDSGRGPGMMKLVRSVSKKFSSKTSAIDSDENGFVNNNNNNNNNSFSSLNKSKKQDTKEDKNNQVRKMMRKDKKDDAQPGGDDAVFQTTSILNISEKDPHDSPRTRSGSHQRSGREKEDETAPNKDTKKEPHNTLGDSTITTGAEDSIAAAKASNNKSKVAAVDSSPSFKDYVININDDVSRSKPATSSRKLKFVSRRSSTSNDDVPDNDDDSCENTVSSPRSRRISTTKTSGSISRQRRSSLAY